MKIDVHQHFWTEPLIEALAGRHELPFVRIEHGLTVLYSAGERPYVLDLTAETYGYRTALAELDGLDRALVCLSSPIGIEALPRSEASPLLAAYHEGVLGLDEPFGAWGALMLDGPDAADVDELLDRGCVGVSLPAGALASVEGIGRLQPVLARLESCGAPLFVHPGPSSDGISSGGYETSLETPLWWPALTRYVADMQAAWLAFLAVGRAAHPKLKVVFAMLAGLAPLHGERLISRGGPDPSLPDPLTFYETSSYGPTAIRALAEVVGPGQLLYGSDRPVIEPGPPPGVASLGFALCANTAAAAERVFGAWASTGRPGIDRDRDPWAASLPSGQPFGGGRSPEAISL